MPDFPSRILFKPTVACPRIKTPPRINGDLSDWEGIDPLPHLLDLEDRPHFAEVYVAWDEAGLYIAEHCPKPEGTVAVNRRMPHSGDGMRVWVDTHATQSAHRATRFCHHFILLPLGGGGMRDEPLAWQINIRRARERPPICDPAEIRIASHIGESFYTIEVHLPTEILNGFEPRPGLQIGFDYLVHDVPAGRQRWASPGGFPGDWDPSLWAILELVD